MSRRSFLRKLDKQGWTNRVYWINFTLVWLFVFICLILTMFSGVLNMDMSFTTAAVTAAFLELGAHTAFIIKKTEAENVTKIKEGSVEIL